jgi:hypothetical protein
MWRNCYGRISMAAEHAYHRGRMLHFYDTKQKLAYFRLIRLGSAG